MPTPLYPKTTDLQSAAVADLLLSHISDHQSLFTLVPCYLVVWVGDLFTVLSPLDSLKLSEGVVYGVLFILDDRASACTYYPDADFQTHISVLVPRAGIEPATHRLMVISSGFEPLSTGLGCPAVLLKLADQVCCSTI